MLRKNIQWVLVLLLVLGGYWLLPIHGTLRIDPGLNRADTDVAPDLWTETATAHSVWVYVRDTLPLVDVQLALSGETFVRDTTYFAGTGPWIWRWQVPQNRLPAVAVFYHNCMSGCQQRLQVNLGIPSEPSLNKQLQPTKLGAVFANPNRDWHGRAAWAVDLTYSEHADQDSWGIDGLALRVHEAHAAGLRVIVRVAFEQGQSLPPRDDQLALSRYLAYCERLARDERLRDVYAFMVGSGYNTLGENNGSLEAATTPAWYARVFNGYGLAPERADNVVQLMHAARPDVRILVGPVTPWNADQTGSQIHPLDQPWLNYMHTVVALINSSTAAKSQRGIALSGADGFAVQAPGRPAAAPQPHLEPQTDLRRAAWGQAQAGFRVYQDWLTSINAFAYTRGAPVYITSSNTFSADTAIPPLQNYPPGWLSSALEEVNREPQIVALCWFVDLPFGDTWVEFSLSEPQGRLFDAADEFDQLLQQ